MTSPLTRIPPKTAPPGQGHAHWKLSPLGLLIFLFAGVAQANGLDGGDASGTSSLAIGVSSIASGAAGVAVGYSTLAYGSASTAVGFASWATNLGSTAIGAQSYASGYTSTAVGSSSRAASENSVAPGSSAIVYSGATNSMALGAYSSVSSGITNAIALGYGSVADSSNTASVGSSGNERRITNVAAGVDGTDAVNVIQLNAAIAGIPSGSLEAAKAYTDQQVAAARVYAARGIAATAAMMNINPLAVDLSVAHSPARNWLLNGGIASSSGGKPVTRIGVGMEF